ncbi:hypothetical protein ACH5RR_020643 [Cinchona calisaya]|uniref:DUF3741 domain-containing protein n=1 Tax=Cinchona calisaya TaxID=153742 RepID=A0ABD2ZF14_9GENT
MKLLTSSSSTSSSTATSFDGNAHNSKSTPAGCIAGVFRRLLCISTLPTHPSDCVSLELDKLQQSIAPTKADERVEQSIAPTKADERVEPSATPSIVARLMGLESLPQIDFSAMEKSPNSIARSHSMNSVDLMKELVKIQGRQHLRVKSFRETAPTFLELEDEDFFVLNFENADESRKSETGSKKMQQRRIKNSGNTRRESVYEKNKENQDPINVVLDGKVECSMNSRKASQSDTCDGKLRDSSNIFVSPTKNACQNSVEVKEVVKLAKKTKNHKPESEFMGRRGRMKKRKDDCLPVKKNETDPQSDSENSSPNSVLDIMKFPGDPEVTSSEEFARLSNSKSRRTLTEELENYKSLIGNASCKSRNSSGCKCAELSKNGHGRDSNNNNNVEMWGEICKIAERDTIQSNWILLNKEIQKFEDYKEIGGEFEIQIFEELMGELVDQLVGNCHQIFDL